MAAVGVDGCASGWIAVVLRDDASAEAHHLGGIAEVRAAVPDAAAIAVDIPIGLPEHRPRRSDALARQTLGPRRNSLFVTPLRAALEAPSHTEATAISRELHGSGVSQQAYRLRAKILEVARWLPEAPCGVWEAHPELSFTELTGRPAAAPKKTWAGMTERRTALISTGVEVDHLDPTATSDAAVDDVLDAALAAWTATRLRDGTARPLPDPPETHPSGRPMAIWI